MCFVTAFNTNVGLNHPVGTDFIIFHYFLVQILSNNSTHKKDFNLDTYVLHENIQLDMNFSKKLIDFPIHFISNDNKKGLNSISFKKDNFINF